MSAHARKAKCTETKKKPHRSEIALLQRATVEAVAVQVQLAHARHRSQLRARMCRACSFLWARKRRAGGSTPTGAHSACMASLSALCEPFSAVVYPSFTRDPTLPPIPAEQRGATCLLEPRTHPLGRIRRGSLTARRAAALRFFWFEASRVRFVGLLSQVARQSRPSLRHGAVCLTPAR